MFFNGLINVANKLDPKTICSEEIGCKTDSKLVKWLGAWSDGFTAGSTDPTTCKRTDQSLRERMSLPASPSCASCPARWRPAHAGSNAHVTSSEPRVPELGQPCKHTHLEVVQGAQVKDCRIGHGRGVRLDHLPGERTRGREREGERERERAGSGQESASRNCSLGWRDGQRQQRGDTGGGELG